jgi:DNA repair exonuclease SbcCD nuclease subunit
MIKLLHAADLHLDSPFAGLAPEQAAARRAGQRQLAAAICQLADRRGCDLVLLAGDIFDSPHPRPETLDALRDAFAACCARIFLAPGNHDYWTPDGPWARTWPRNVHIFRSAAPEAVPLPDLDCTVYGAAFTAPEMPGLLQNFHTNARHAVMVLHGDATQKKSPYGPVTPAQIAASGLQYLALGHIHGRSGLLRAGTTYFAWPGCPEGRGFDECGPKGVFEVTVDDEVRAAFLPLPGVRYEDLSVDITGGDAAALVREALPPDGRVHARVTLTGEGQVSLSALQQQLAGQYASLDLRDETTAPQQLWQSADPNTLRGLFLLDLQQQWQAADAAQRAVLEQAARLGLAALDGREVYDL